MLTDELLRGNAATAGLTDEQRNAIVEMSRNDENQVIAQKTGELYGGLDADILAASGIEKNGAEKTYDYVKRVIGEMKQQAGTANEKQATIDSLTREKARLEKVIADGGADAETKKQLAQAQKDLNSITKSYTDLKSEFDASTEKHEKEIFGIKLDGELDKAVGSIKFKADLPEAVRNVLLGNAKEKVKGMTPEYIDNGAGGKILAFKGVDGAILRNPENNLNPFTAAELVTKELASMGVLETGKKTQGAGSGSGSGSGGGSFVMDLTGVKTQTEADDVITKALLAQGMTIASKQFEETKTKIWSENNIKSLPIQ